MESPKYKASGVLIKHFSAIIKIKIEYTLIPYCFILFSPEFKNTEQKLVRANSILINLSYERYHLFCRFLWKLFCFYIVISTNSIKLIKIKFSDRDK